MLSKEERNEMRRRPNKMDEEMSNLYDVLTSFYPAQQLTLTLTKEDVTNIMNCEDNETQRYLKEVQSSSDEIINWPILLEKRSNVNCGPYSIYYPRPRYFDTIKDWYLLIQANHTSLWNNNISSRMPL